MAKKIISVSIDEKLCDKILELAGQQTAKTSKRVSTSQIIEAAVIAYLKDKPAKIESKPLEGVKTKATTSKPKKQGKDSQSYQIFEAVFAGYGKDSKGNAVVLFQSIQSSEPGLVHEASSKHKQTGKAIKEFLATKPKQGDKIRFEAFIENGKIAQPRKIEIL